MKKKASISFKSNAPKQAKKYRRKQENNIEKKEERKKKGKREKARVSINCTNLFAETQSKRKTISKGHAAQSG